MMNIKNYKKGESVRFELGNKNIDANFYGKFDFLYCFDTNVIMLPVVCSPETGISIVIANFALLQKYGLTNDEIKAILYHEEGHMLSTGQKDKIGLDVEFDADEYALTFVNHATLTSALEKTKEVIVNESTNKEKIPEKLENVNKRIEHIQSRKRCANDINR